MEACMTDDNVVQLIITFDVCFDTSTLYGLEGLDYHAGRFVRLTVLDKRMCQDMFAATFDGMDEC